MRRASVVTITRSAGLDVSHDIPAFGGFTACLGRHGGFTVARPVRWPTAKPE